jgi:hypothetical protein
MNNGQPRVNCLSSHRSSVELINPKAETVRRAQALQVNITGEKEDTIVHREQIMLEVLSANLFFHSKINATRCYWIGKCSPIEFRYCYYHLESHLLVHGSTLF